MMRPQRPLDMKLGTGRVNQEKPRPFALLDKELDQLKRRGVGPMQILDRDDGRLHPRRAQRQLDERGQQAARAVVERWSAADPACEIEVSRPLAKDWNDLPDAEAAA